jgi:hypothetical protein
VVTITQDFGQMDYSLSEDNGMLVYHGNIFTWPKTVKFSKILRSDMAITKV